MSCKNKAVTLQSQKGKEVKSLPKTDQGAMLEWLKRHAWKACVRQKRTAGSNPACSAKEIKEAMPDIDIASFGI